ncbi:MAG: type VI secretion system protein TssA [Myxococcales bacterium]|nr:type VI secretion system protein TssA [Myxococcales bacterium]
MTQEHIEQSKARIEDLLEPILGGAGQDVSYDESFEVIKVEIEKLQSLAGDACNWGVVSSTSETILRERSKDFRIAAYLAASKMRQGSLASLLDGLLLMSQLTERYWETMFPPLNRIRARAGMIGWMSDQSGEAVGAIPLKAGDAALVATIDEVSRVLDTSFREKFADHYPGMSKVRDAIREHVRRVPADAPPPPPPPLPRAEGDAAPPSASAPSGTESNYSGGGGGGATAETVNSADQARDALEPTMQLVVKIGHVLRAERPDNPVAFRLTRFAAYLPLIQAPPATDGVTMVPAPEDYLRQRLDALVAGQDWLTLLEEAESMATEYLLWLDLHRYSSAAMSALGPKFTKAKDEATLQLALVLKRLPTFGQLKFSDGTPFADGQTQMWLDAEVRPVLAAGGAGGGGGSAASGPLDEPIREAREQAMKGELGEALATLGRASDAAPSPADRFRGKLALAQLCLGAGQFDIARGQLEGLAAKIRSHDLTGWDPKLCADVYAALYAAQRGAFAGYEAPPEAAVAMAAVFAQLCQLDPAAALKLRS